MFRRIFVANRGEVAVRIARAAQSLSIEAVCAVSTADRDASWTEAFESVVCVGESAPSRSYLRAEALVQAARQSRCSAVHPGWGFLAENPRFAALCLQHGLTFIGPRPAVTERMGLKWPAKAAMAAAGLEGIPGSEGVLAGPEEALQAARRVGYPVLLKADAGGGGRGMRLAQSEEELPGAYEAAHAEAAAAFGNGSLYLERYQSGGRHIEVQLLCDAYGKALHLFERECSIQRKHQKLIEESPSPALSDSERAELGTAAARAARQVGYTGAGTIEFLRPRGESRLCFMEMNTRLQVEHPVSEAVTGIDIVQEQLRIAAAEPLALEQSQIALDGHAIELRINAEDPSADFKPCPGTLTRFDLPRDRGPGRVRVDTHLRAGDRVSPFYDSLLAKVICHAESREAAIETALRALEGARIEGVPTTIPLHLAVLASDAFARGDYDTASIPGWTA